MHIPAPWILRVLKHVIKLPLIHRISMGSNGIHIGYVPFRTFARSPNLTWCHGLPGSPPGSPPRPRRTPVAGTTSRAATKPTRKRRRGATGKPRRPWRSRPRSGSGRPNSGSAGQRRKRNEGRSDRGNGRNFSDLVSWWGGFFWMEMGAGKVVMYFVWSRSMMLWNWRYVVLGWMWRHVCSVWGVEAAIGLSFFLVVLCHIQGDTAGTGMFSWRIIWAKMMDLKARTRMRKARTVISMVMSRDEHRPWRARLPDLTWACVPRVIRDGWICSNRGGWTAKLIPRGVTSNYPAVEGVGQDLATAVGLLKHFARLTLIPVTGQWAQQMHKKDPRSRRCAAPMCLTRCSAAGEAKIRWSWVNLGWVQTNPNS